MTASPDRRFCVVVPAYQEEGRIGSAVRGIREYCPDVIVVDDGSADRTAAEAREAGATVLVHERNLGKGRAVETGTKHAAEGGFAFVIAMDGDGQHDPADIPGFVKTFERTGAALVVGNRMGNRQAMPLVRRWTNLYMSWLLSRRMGQRVPDTQSGFRLYRADVLPYLSTECDRFAADSEVLLLVAEKGYRIGSVPIHVIYRDEKSKIRPIRDTIRFFAMLHRYERGRRRRAAGTGGGRQ